MPVNPLKQMEHMLKQIEMNLLHADFTFMSEVPLNGSRYGNQRALKRGETVQIELMK